jgi:tetratricopeptide (TPR) repeat protein
VERLFDHTQDTPIHSIGVDEITNDRLAPPPQEGPTVTGMDQGFLTVGLMAQRSGLTVKALRHDDRVGLLPPVTIDRHRVPAHRTDHLLAEGLESAMSELDPVAEAATAKSAPGTGSVTDQRLLAAQLFNETWRLMEQEDRSRDDDDRMIHTAHASRYHWGQVTDANRAQLARGEWQISRVYTVLGRPEPALHHARRVLDICQENGIGDWDLAFAYEALARAFAVAGDAGQTRSYTDQALAAAKEIAEDDDRAILLADLETIPGQPRYW